MIGEYVDPDTFGEWDDTYAESVAGRCNVYGLRMIVEYQIGLPRHYSTNTTIHTRRLNIYNLDYHNLF